MARKLKVVVIGAGPAGMMAAGQAALDGADVVLLEKKDRPGRKLAITGKGRCNLTNDCDLKNFMESFGKAGKYLRQALTAFFVDDLRSFFDSQGVETKVERGQRVFPVSESAVSVVEALVCWLKKCDVQILTGACVRSIEVKDKAVSGVRTRDGFIAADRVIVATGGASYPATGSEGDGYRLTSRLGHKVIPALPALVPLVTAGDTASQMQGVSLRNVSATLWVQGKKQGQEFGELLFTHFGLSGPIILTMSRAVVQVLKQGQSVEIGLDLKPALDHQKLDIRLQRDINEMGRAHAKKLLKGLLPLKMVAVAARLAGIDPDMPVNRIQAGQRKKLTNLLKDWRFQVVRHRPLREAIVTAGGVATKEVNPRTMESRIVRGLYICGELLDVDADTGGYNLQAAFSTGRMAGQNAAVSED